MRFGLSSLLLLSASLLPVAAHADVYNFTLSGSGLNYNSQPYTDVYTFSIDTVNDPYSPGFFDPTENDYMLSSVTDTYTVGSNTPSVSNPPPFIQIGTSTGLQYVGMGEIAFAINNGADFWDGTTFTPNAVGSPYSTTLEGSSSGPQPYSLDIVDAGPSPSLSATPEPSSLALLGTGVLGMFGVARRRFVR